MAGIKQAVKWMKRDRDVCRSSDPLDVFNVSEHFDGAIMVSRCESIASFARLTANDLLAEDWEIAE